MRQLKIDVLSVLVVTDKLMFIVIGARDFSPEITVHLIGTSVFALRATPRQESPVLRQSSSPANFNLSLSPSNIL